MGELIQEADENVTEVVTPKKSVHVTKKRGKDTPGEQECEQSFQGYFQSNFNIQGLRLQAFILLF